MNETPTGLFLGFVGSTGGVFAFHWVPTGSILAEIGGWFRVREKLQVRLLSDEK